MSRRGTGLDLRVLEAGRDRPAGRLLDLALPLVQTALAARTPRLAPAPRRRREARRTDRVAQQLHGGAAILALAVLADSGLEHYRGMFFNKAMYAPLAASTLSLAASAHGLVDRRPLSHGLRDGIYGTAAAAGLAGLGFHAWNLGKREGGLSWLNLFYGAPIGAPAALLLAGLIGLSAERVREAPPGHRPRLLGRPAGRVLGSVTVLGLLGTVGEAALLHFRGAFHNPFMFVPVTLPPVAAGLLGWATLRRHARRPRRLARLWLRLTAWMGLAGVGFHAFGVHRNMGGWRNWSQNVLNGPPLPAPPSFTGLALAGLAALRLQEREQRADG